MYIENQDISIENLWDYDLKYVKLSKLFLLYILKREQNFLVLILEKFIFYTRGRHWENQWTISLLPSGGRGLIFWRMRKQEKNLHF